MSDEWFYARDGEQAGPYSLAQLKCFATIGRLKRTDHVWTEGMTEWLPAGELAQLYPSASTGSHATFATGAPRTAANAAPREVVGPDDRWQSYARQFAIEIWRTALVATERFRRAVTSNTTAARKRNTFAIGITFFVVPLAILLFTALWVVPGSLSLRESPEAAGTDEPTFAPVRSGPKSTTGGRRATATNTSPDYKAAYQFGWEVASQFAGQYQDVRRAKGVPQPVHRHRCEAVLRLIAGRKPI